MSSPAEAHGPAVTIEQAEGFIEALLGWNKRNMKSPHARTHLEGQFGKRLPSAFDVATARTAAGVDERARFRPLAAYLRGIADAIDRACDEGEADAAG